MAEFFLFNPVPIPMSDARIRKANYSLRYSPKLDDDAEMESELEDRHYVWLESDPNVVGLCPQPLHINERINGKKLNTILDAWTKEANGHEVLWEVKPYDKLKPMPDDTLAPAKWPLISVWANYHGADVRFVTDREIEANACLIDGWMRALPYIGKAATRHTEHISRWLLSRLKGGLQSTLHELIDDGLQYRPDDVITGIVRLLHNGQLSSDMASRPFGQSTVITGA